MGQIFDAAMYLHAHPGRMFSMRQVSSDLLYLPLGNLGISRHDYDTMRIIGCLFHEESQLGWAGPLKGCAFRLSLVSPH